MSNTSLAPELESFDDTPLLNALQTLTALLGRQVAREHLTYGLQAGSNDVTLDSVTRVLHRVGLAANVSKVNTIEDRSLPGCVQLRDGQVVVIVRRDNDEFVLASTDTPGGERRLKVKELHEAFDGTVITALPTLDDLSRRHLGPSSTGHWFWQQFHHQKALLANIALGSLFANLLAVAVSLFALQVYDRVIPNQSISSLWVLVIGGITAIVLEATLRVARSSLLDVSGKSIEINLSRFLMERLTGMKLSQRPASPGSLTHLMREFSSVREFFTNASIGSVADLPFVLLFLALIHTIAGPVTWIIVAGMVLIVMPSLLCQGRMSRLSREMLGGSSAASKLLTEMTYGQESVKATAGEAHFQSQWEEITALNAIKTSEQRALAAALTHWSSGIQQATYIATVVAGVYAVFAGDATVGTIIAISILSSRTLAPVTQLSGALSRWQLVKSALTGLDAIAHSAQERDADRTYSRKQVLDGDIALANVSFSYAEEGLQSLDIHKLSIQDGSVVAVLGENGSGKSTLLKVLSGLFSVTSGSVSVGGLDLAHLDPADLRRNVGYLSQEIRLFSGTLRDNLLMGIGNVDDDRIQQALQFSGLYRLVMRSPLGLDTEIQDGGDGMSVGQRHSLGLARLYLQDPRIVLLDEPTASLDQNLENSLVKSLETWLVGRTCIIATHRVPILSLAQRILVLQNGQISLDGSTNDVLKKLTARPVEKS